MVKDHTFVFLFFWTIPLNTYFSADVTAVCSSNLQQFEEAERLWAWWVGGWNVEPDLDTKAGEESDEGQTEGQEEAGQSVLTTTSNMGIFAQNSDNTANDI